VVGIGGVVAADEVDRHVVRRTERRREAERAARREGGDLVERHERGPQHDGVADRVEPSSTSAAGELRVLPGRQELVLLSGELGELLDHHRARRHVDAERERLGREHGLH
jgi:hypothetical protein